MRTVSESTRGSSRISAHTVSNHRVMRTVPEDFIVMQGLHLDYVFWGTLLGKSLFRREEFKMRTRAPLKAMEELD